MQAEEEKLPKLQKVLQTLINVGDNLEKFEKV